MLAILKKELFLFFTTWIGYVFVLFFLILSAMLFVGPTLAMQKADLSEYFANLSLLLVLFVPMLTMKSLTGEKSDGTERLLLAAPVSSAEIVFGKYFACIGVFKLTLALTLIFPIMLANIAEVYWLAIIGQYLGFGLLGCAFISVGLFFSAITENQVVAAVSSFGVLLVLFLVNIIKRLIDNAVLLKLVSVFAITDRFSPFLDGTLDLSACVYMLSFSAAFIYLTIRSLEKKRYL